METERQRSKCTRESTGTTFNQILSVLTSIYFIKPALVASVPTVISLILLGRRFRQLFLLAFVVLVNSLAQLLTSDPIIRFCLLIFLLSTGCYVLYSLTNQKVIALGFMGAVVGIAVIPILFMTLGASITSAFGMAYVYSLVVMLILGVLLLITLLSLTSK